MSTENKRSDTKKLGNGDIYKQFNKHIIDVKNNFCVYF